MTDVRVVAELALKPVRGWRDSRQLVRSARSQDPLGLEVEVVSIVRVVMNQLRED